MDQDSPDNRSGCGLLKALMWPKRATSAGSVCTQVTSNIAKDQGTPRRRKSGSDESAFLGNSSIPAKPNTKPSSQPKFPPIQQQQQRQINGRRPSHNQATKVSDHQIQYDGNQGRKVPQGMLGISGELDALINDHQRTAGSSTLVRASSSNVMLSKSLGNLRGGGGASSVLDQLPKPAKEEVASNGKYPNSVMGNVVKEQQGAEHQNGSLCRALSTRMDPEQLKIMGNEDYKNGNFAEALALYDAAIAIDPKKASYRSNKSAALTALGRLLEAVFECREAIQIEPGYHRAHHRLANLYLRLGEAEKSVYHYKHAGPEADHVDVSKAKALQVKLISCTEARKMRDWSSLIKETNAAISAGADSAPHIYALKAEALLKLHRHQEADETLTNGPNFDADACTDFFGPIANANLLVVRAQVDLAIGRFDDALAAAQRATRLDPNNREANSVMRRARAIGAARCNGNQLFRAAKFQEACVTYGDGLEHDPHNSVLLCNRAACRSKLHQYEKAAEDCTAALHTRPSYAKARLRRADCYAKLGKWEASIKDYEILQKDCPEDEEVAQGLEEAKRQLKKQNRDNVVGPEN